MKTIEIREKSFITNPAFRNMMLKGLFIGLAVKAATALKDQVVALYDTFREFGVSWDSMPLAAGIAKEEAKAMLDEFGSLEKVTSKQLLNMKMMSYWTGVQGTDMAKIMMLQQSTTNLSKDQALDKQSKWMKELKREGGK